MIQLYYSRWKKSSGSFEVRIWYATPGHLGHEKLFTYFVMFKKSQINGLRVVNTIQSTLAASSLSLERFFTQTGFLFLRSIQEVNVVDLAEPASTCTSILRISHKKIAENTLKQFGRVT